jgi:hypothetical protein
MAQTINIQKLWDQKYQDESQPFPIDGTPDGFNLADGSVTGPKLADGAVTGAKLADGTITDGDISASAAIAASKLAAGTDGQVLTSSGGVAEWGAAGSSGGAAGGDLIGTYPNPTLAPHVVGTSNLVSGAVTDNEISNSAAINPAKLAPAGTSGYVLTTLGSSVAWAAASGGGASSAAALRFFDTKDYGAKSDLRQATTASVTAGNATISGTNYSGTATDAGKLVRIQAAGVTLFSGTDGVMASSPAATKNQFTSSGSSFDQRVVGRWLVITGQFTARIIGVESATQLRLATPAGSGFSGATWRIADDHYSAVQTSVAGVSATLAAAPLTSVTNATIWYGTDDSTAIQAAVAAAESATAPNFGGQGNVVYHFGPSAIGTPINLTKPTQFIGAGSRGYGSVLAVGRTRLMLMKPAIRGIVGGGTDVGMGINGSMTSGSAVLTDPEANFPVGLAGNIIVYQAGTQIGSTDGIYLNTTIASRDSATQLTLAATAGTTITHAIYSYATTTGYTGGIVGPSVKNVHIIGGPGQKAGLHLMNASESIVEEVSCSDFGSGIAHFIDPGPSTGFSNQFEMRSCYAIDSRIGVKHHRGGLILTGQGMIDGNSNRVDCHVPVDMTIGVDGNNIRQGGVWTVQSVGTGVKAAGQGGGTGCTGVGWGFECIGTCFDLASDGASGGHNHLVGIQTVGSSNSGGGYGVKLRSGAHATLTRGYSLDSDIDMFGLVDAAANLVVIGEKIQKSGSVSDTDFTNQPWDGAEGYDTSTGDVYRRIAGNWRKTTTIGVASRVRRLDIKAPGSAQTSQILTVPSGKVVAGHHVIVAVAYGQASTRTVTVADSKGNTYQQDAAADLTTGQTPHALIFSSHITTQLVAGDTITVTFSASASVPICGAYEYSGIASSSWLDQTATATGTGTTASSGNITTTAASEVLVGVICNGGVSLATATVEAGWSEADNVSTAGAKNIEVEDLVVFATGTHAATAALSGSNDWAAVVASYKAA